MEKNEILYCPDGHGFKQINDIPRFVDNSQYTESFGIQWGKYRRTQLDSYTGLPITAKRTEICLGPELWNNLKGKLVLECGCGAGRFTEILLGRGARVLSVDLSSAVQANLENFPLNKNHRIAQADICNLPFKDGRFDMVFCLGVVQHTSSPEQTILALYKQVKPGGALVFDHYKPDLSWYTKTAPIFRQILKRLKPEKRIEITEMLVNFFFPLHKLTRHFYLGQIVLSRFSPVSCYFHAHPALNDRLQYEWALLDTHDGLTDHYKHFRSKNRIYRVLKRLFAQGILCDYNGNVVEARVKRYRLSDLKLYFLVGNLGCGGAERQLYNIISILVRQGLYPRVISLTKGDYWEDKYRNLGADVVWIGKRKSKIMKLIAVFKILYGKRVDVFQSFHFYTNIYVGLCAKVLGIYGIGAIRSNCIDEIADTGKIFGKFCLKLPNILVANSNPGYDNAIKLGKSSSKLFKLNNAVDTEVFKPDSKNHDNTFTIISVGRLGPEKNFNLFLQVIKNVVRKMDEKSIKAVIVGRGPLEFQLKQESCALGLKDIVEFKNLVTDMPALYNESDLLLLQSEFEGTPNVILEAMACGLPVVASKVGGIPDIIIHGKNGFLFNLDDLNSAENIVLELAGNKDLRNKIGKNAREFIINNNSMEKLKASLAELYSMHLEQ
ncbi:MAG: glycosyltransferase [bacterium]